MNKDNNARNSQTQSSQDREYVAPIPNAQRESRSDQEQEGTQNPAGDTREVSREPVEQPNEQHKN